MKLSVSEINNIYDWGKMDAEVRQGYTKKELVSIYNKFFKTPLKASDTKQRIIKQLNYFYSSEVRIKSLVK